METPDLERMGRILEAVRDLAIKYHEVTGKPLGITGEVAEYEAARLLGLHLCEARQSGYDALMVRGTATIRVQIKGRRIVDCKPSAKMGHLRGVENPRV